MSRNMEEISAFRPNIWKSVSMAEESCQMRNLELTQNWKKLENKMDMMEMKLGYAQKIRDDYLTFLKKKYPNWTTAPAKNHQVQNVGRPRKPFQLHPEVPLSDKMATRKYWQFNPEERTSSLSILQSLHSDSSNSQNPAITDKGEKMKADYLEQRDLKQIKADISWIKDRIQGISQELHRLNGIVSNTHKTKGNFNSEKNTSALIEASTFWVESNHKNDGKNLNLNQEEQNDEESEKLKSVETEAPLNISWTDKLPQTPPKREKDLPLDVSSNSSIFQSKPEPPLRQHKGPPPTYSETSYVPAQKSSTLDFRGIMNFMGNNKEKEESSDTDSIEDKLRGKTSSAQIKQTEPEPLPRKKSVPNKEPMSTLDHPELTTESKSSTQSVHPVNTETKESPKTVDTEPKRYTSEDFLAKLFPERYGDGTGIQKGMGLSKPNSETVKKPLILKGSDSDSDIEVPKKTSMYSGMNKGSSDEESDFFD